jgi:hypothetical protein
MLSSLRSLGVLFNFELWESGRDALFGPQDQQERGEHVNRVAECEPGR